MNEPVLLEVDELQKYFPIRKGFLRRAVGNVRAVDRVSFRVNERETVGLVGESGCGKTTVGRCIVKLLNPTGGSMRYHRDGDSIDIASPSSGELLAIRQNIQMIFQNPYSSLHPRMRVADIIREPLRIHRIGTAREQKDKVAALIEKVGLRTFHLDRYPHEFSGGQRQRIGIARALVTEPRLVICDEAVSALDVSIQAQIINLLKDLQSEFGLAYLFIAHNLSVVEYISDRIVVMYLGRVAEVATAEEIYRAPKHPYTEALLSAIPVPDPKAKKTGVTLTGGVPSPASPPSGCYFHTRCPYARDLCKREVPALRPVGDGESTRVAACHFADELSLKAFDERVGTTVHDAS